MNSTAMNHPSALLSYANAAADNGNGEQAKTMLRQILAEHPNSTEASIARATLRTLATAAVRVVDVDISFGQMISLVFKVFVATIVVSIGLAIVVTAFAFVFGGLS